MGNWTQAELKKIAAADDLHISPFGARYSEFRQNWVGR